VKALSDATLSERLLSDLKVFASRVLVHARKRDLLTIRVFLRDHFFVYLGAFDDVTAPRLPLLGAELALTYIASVSGARCVGYPQFEGHGRIATLSTQRIEKVSGRKSRRN